MTLKDTVQTAIKKFLPRHWPWEPGPTARRVVWMVHMAVVLGTIAFAVFTAYLLFSSSLFSPEVAPSGGASPSGKPAQPKKPPLPYWIRVFKSFSFLVTPLVSYFIYYALPEPKDESE
jgi:hypothetical protein